MFKYILPPLLIVALLPSCSGLLPGGGIEAAKKLAYERGFQAGRAQEIKRINAEVNSLPLPAAPVERRYTSITIPEQMLPTGEIIEEHVEYVETVY